ncbi:MAG: GlsB/YeaQ/YmgE family stress response membrane protein [Gemmatimonadota bacterium]
MIWWICVGLVAGWATGKLMKGSGYGALMDIVIGVAGAVMGGFLMRTLGFAGAGGFIYTVIVAVLGAVVLLWLIHAITGKRPNP